MIRKIATWRVKESWAWKYSSLKKLNPCSYHSNICFYLLCRVTATIDLPLWEIYWTKWKNLIRGSLRPFKRHSVVEQASKYCFTSIRYTNRRPFVLLCTFCYCLRNMVHIVAYCISCTDAVAGTVLVGFCLLYYSQISFAIWSKFYEVMVILVLFFSVCTCAIGSYYQLMGWI